MRRASCKALASQRQSELQQALAAAREAVDLYRDALDYPSMTIAQFNVAVTQRLLGEDEASLASLAAAKALDEEFGLRQDAADNARLLARWRGDTTKNETAKGDVVQSGEPPATDSAVRTVTLKTWRPGFARVSVQVDDTAVIAGHITRARAHRTFEQQVRRDGGDWVVSSEPGEIGYDVAQWPDESSDVLDLVASFEHALSIPTFQVGSKGGFDRVRSLREVSAQQFAAARALMRDHLGLEEGPVALDGQESRVMQLAFHPLTIQTVVAEDYNFQVGMWSGAALEQGVWYKLAAPLTAPGARQLLIPNDIEFAYTRDVPCTETASTQTVSQLSCVEIVVHATPQAAAVKDLTDRFDYPFVKRGNQRVHYWSTTYIRIVTDPETLAIRVYDVRRYWHAYDRKAVNEPTENRSERIVTTFVYPTS